MDQLLYSAISATVTWKPQVRKDKEFKLLGQMDFSVKLWHYQLLKSSYYILHITYLAIQITNSLENQLTETLTMENLTVSSLMELFRITIGWPGEREYRDIMKKNQWNKIFCIKSVDWDKNLLNTVMITLDRFRNRLIKFLANKSQVKNRKRCLFFNRFLLQHALDLESLREATEKIERINPGMLTRSTILELRNSFTWK